VEERTSFDTSPNEFRESVCPLPPLYQPFCARSYTICVSPWVLTAFHIPTEYAKEQSDVIIKLSAARKLLPLVQVPMEIRLKISQV